MRHHKTTAPKSHRAVPLALGLLILAGVAHSLVVRPAFAAPAWGANCLSCHDVVLTNVISVMGEDTQADPDESATGAPDRGTLPTYQAQPGSIKTLQVEVFGLNLEDVYAVELKRLRSPGVVAEEVLEFSGDCLWAYWGEPGRYFTQPPVSFSWGTGPTVFSFDVTVDPGAQEDYHDLVFAVAGRGATTHELFYAETHFYLQILPSEEAIFRDQFESGSLSSWTINRQGR